MKRTKTPQQLHQQWQRIKTYVKKRGKFKTYIHIYAHYCNRMADYNGESPYWHNGKFYYNERNNAPVPVSIYTVE